MSTRNDRYVKVIVSGHVIEVYKMDREPVAPPKPDPNEHEHIFMIPPILEQVRECPYSGQLLRFKFKNPEFELLLKEERERIRKREKDKEDRKEERRAQTVRDTRNRIRRLCINNFSHESKFITLTFAENVTDLDEANKEFKKYIQRLRRRYGDFKYISVIEFQKRGAVHYHMISDLPFIQSKVLSDLWGNGFIRINEIEHVDNVGAYVTKYMTKENDDPRLQGKKMYLCSKGLDKPKEYKGFEAETLINALELDNKKAVYRNSYESEYCGKINYNEYNLKR